MNAPALTLDVEGASDGKIRYRVGSLKYTAGALASVLFWMLWADLALQIMELLQTLVPIQLERIGASGVVVGLIRDTLQAALTLLILPIIGAQSDHHRGPLGRRRPFLLWSILPVGAFLIALGYADPISQVLHKALSGIPLVGGFAPQTVGIFVIAFFVGGFFLFNNYALPVYQYLIADVVPREIMGKFVGAYRAIGAISGFLFNKLLFPRVDAHIEYIYVTCTVFYAFAFLLLVWRVKEGQYPPPEKTEKRLGPVEFIRRYAKLCFSHSFYWKVYLTSLCYWAAMVPFYTQGMLYFKADPQNGKMTALGISPTELGDIRGWTFLPQLLMFPICGYLIDRFHALRFLVIGFWTMATCFIVGVVFAFSQPDITPVKSQTAKTLVTVCDIKDGELSRTARVLSVKEIKDIQRAGEKALSDVPEGTPAGVMKTFQDKLVSNPDYEAYLQKGLLGRMIQYLGSYFTGQSVQPRIPSATERILVTVRTGERGRPVRTEETISISAILKAGEAKLTEISQDAPTGATKFFEDKFYCPAPRWAFWWWFAMMLALAVIQLSYLAMQPALFPEDNYGQFFSANHWISCIGLVLAPLISGITLDVCGSKRVIFIWSAVLFTAAAVLSVAVFRHWKRLGGDQHYTPPRTSHEQ